MLYVVPPVATSASQAAQHEVIMQPMLYAAAY
jgi:hypothetical protein